MNRLDPCLNRSGPAAVRGPPAARPKAGDPRQRARPSAHHRPGPGTRVHASGIPGTIPPAIDCAWLGVDKASFTMNPASPSCPWGSAYPGRGQRDLPPRPECAPTWHDKVLMLLQHRADPAHRPVCAGLLPAGGGERVAHRDGATLGGLWPRPGCRCRTRPRATPSGSGRTLVRAGSDPHLQQRVAPCLTRQARAPARPGGLGLLRPWRPAAV